MTQESNRFRMAALGESLESRVDRLVKDCRDLEQIVLDQKKTIQELEKSIASLKGDEG